MVRIRRETEQAKDFLCGILASTRVRYKSGTNGKYKQVFTSVSHSLSALSELDQRAVQWALHPKHRCRQVHSRCRNVNTLTSEKNGLGNAKQTTRKPKIPNCLLADERGSRHARVGSSTKTRVQTGSGGSSYPRGNNSRPASSAAKQLPAHHHSQQHSRWHRKRPQAPRRQLHPKSAPRPVRHCCC